MSGVKVIITAKACSTTTNSYGFFSIAIPAPTSVTPLIISKMVMIQDEGLSVLDLRGCVIRKDKNFSSGFCLLRVKTSEGEIVSKMLNLGSIRKSAFLPVSVQGKTADVQVLAKLAASSYLVSVSAIGYKSVSKSIIAGQTTDIKMVPQDALVTVNVDIDSVGIINVNVIIPKD